MRELCLFGGVLLLLAVAALAQGEALMVPALGTDAVPVSQLSPHLRFIRFADGSVVENGHKSRYPGESGGPGLPIYFEELLRADGTVVLGRDAKKRPCHWWLSPPDPDDPNPPPRVDSLTHNMIVPGEWLLVDFVFPTPPPRPFLKELWAQITLEFDIAALDTAYRQAIREWGDDHAQDMYDVQVRRWSSYRGGTNPEGWYEPVNPRLDGYSNCHYDDLQWLALNWLLHSDGQADATWRYGVHTAVAHALYGVCHSKNSRYYGMPWYEKSGFDPVYGWRVVGGINDPPNHGKKWIRGLILWTLLTRSELLGHVLQQRLDALLLPAPNQVWNGDWGARIMALHLDDLFAAWKLTKLPAYRAKADACIRHAITFVDAVPWPDGSLRGVWINTGPGAMDTSTPAFNAELVAAAMRWMNVGVAVDLLPAYAAVGEAVWHEGTRPAPEWHPYAAAGVPVGDREILRSPWYRFFGPEAGRAPLSHLGYFVGMLRWMARLHPTAAEYWQHVYDVHARFTYSHIDGAWGRAPDGAVHYHEGYGGDAHSLALKQALRSAVH